MELGQGVMGLKHFKRIVRSIYRVHVVRVMASWMVTQYVRLVWVTGRWTVHGPQSQEAKWDSQEPFILAFWHGRILMMPKSWRPGVRIHMLISQHRDGEMITRVVKPFGIETIRGSTARSDGFGDKGGAGALREILRVLKGRGCVGITPDGPRGPRMRATEGVLVIARLSGVPIIPATWASRRRWELGSWDRFLIPKLFSKGVIVWGEPVVVPRHAQPAELESLRLQLEAAMVGLTEEADALVGISSAEAA